jgi:hypothetical protein
MNVFALDVKIKCTMGHTKKNHRTNKPLELISICYDEIIAQCCKQQSEKKQYESEFKLHIKKGANCFAPPLTKINTM